MMYPMDVAALRPFSIWDQILSDDEMLSWATISFLWFCENVRDDGIVGGNGRIKYYKERRQFISLMHHLFPDKNVPRYNCVWCSDSQWSQVMPVGCLGVGSRSQADSSLYLDNIDSAPGQDGDQVSDKAETFHLLQHKLLIQIFRVEPQQLTASSGSGGSKLTCTTCQPWSEQCCQVDSGWSVMASLVSANLRGFCLAWMAASMSPMLRSWSLISPRV